MVADYLFAIFRVSQRVCFPLLLLLDLTENSPSERKLRERMLSREEAQ